MRVILPILICAFCAGIILATDTNKDLFLAWNAAAQWLSPFLWAGITNLGNTFGAFCLLAPTLAKHPRWTAAALLTVPSAGLFTHAIKRLADLPRPAAILPPETFHIIDSTLLGRSFPSGHSVTAFAAAGILVFCSRRRLAWLVLPVAMLVAFSRIAVGAHWPLDLFAGAAGGWATAALGCALSARWRFWENAHGQRILAGTVFFCALMFVFEQTGYPRGDWMQYLLCAIGLLGALYAMCRPAALRKQSSPSGQEGSKP
ncbi:MAG: phosphatase PAP2 family protein [Azoarcus sp.]|jgi:membrane-associated phospholipid phosphatase|nr:phosphatase PAP2 family protein [Azoarcus sp.]